MEKILESYKPKGDLIPVFTNDFSLVKDGPCISRQIPLGSGYALLYGNTVYEINEFKFYDFKGGIYSARCLFIPFSDREEFLPRHINFPNPKKLPLRLGISDFFDWGKAYDSAAIFFTSLGHRNSTKMKADLYVPLTYCLGLGLDIVESTKDRLKTTLLRTPLFEIILEVVCVPSKELEDAKQKIIEHIQECETTEDLHAVLYSWESIIESGESGEGGA